MLVGAVLLWRAVDWLPVRIQLSPAAWLVRDVARGGPLGTLAAEELNRRIQNGRYEGEQLEAAVRALRPVTVRPLSSTVRMGDGLSLNASFAPPIRFQLRRPGERPDGRYYVYRRLSRHRFGNGPWVEAGPWWLRKPVLSGDGSGWPLKVPAGTPLGETAVEIVFAFRVVRADRERTPDNSPQPASHAEPPPDAEAAWEVTVEHPVTILPPDAQASVPASRPTTVSPTP